MMRSVWNATAELPRFPLLEKDLRVKVLIIGGGMSGLLTAYFLHQRGVDYALVEKGRLLGGTTGNTTAKLTAQHGLIYHKLRDPAQYLQANLLALRQYEHLCRKIDCGYRRQDNYVYSVDGRQKLERELEALQRIGYPADFVKKLPLPIHTVGAVRFSDQAEFHPLQFAAELVKDLHIYENTAVEQMVGNTAVTQKAKIRAEKVIVATHFPFINKHGSYFLKLYQHRSYVLALKNAPDVNGMYVDDSKTGLSFRNYDGSLLLGGGGHRTGQQGGNWNELRNFAHHYYPEAKEVCFWSAQDCMTLDGMPYIGEYSGLSKNLYVACGFNKWGMTGSMVAAMLLADQVTDKKNEFSGLFDPSRSILHPQLLVNGYESVKNLLSASPKRCPHMGCALKWNAPEHSWDCPCHGSRFTKNGELLENPATGRLK